MLLALEAVGAGVSVALLEAGDEGAARVIGLERDDGRDAGDRLVALVRDLARAAGVPLGALGAIAVDRGPGGFTAIRSAVAAARGFALAAGCPLYAVTRFEVLAAAAGPAPGRMPTVAAIAAGRGTVQVQAFAHDLEPLGNPRASAPEAALEGLVRPLRLTGSGAQLLVDHAPDPDGLEVVAPEVDAAVVGRLVVRRRTLGLAPVRPFTLEPLYLRPPDAAPPRRLIERRNSSSAAHARPQA